MKEKTSRKGNILKSQIYNGVYHVFHFSSKKFSKKLLKVRGTDNYLNYLPSLC